MTSVFRHRAFGGRVRWTTIGTPNCCRCSGARSAPKSRSDAALLNRLVWVADSFQGLPVPSRDEDAGWDLSKDRWPSLAVGLDEVKELFDRYELLDQQVKFLPGWFRDTLPSAPIESLAILRLDGDLYESTMDALESLYDKLQPGGFLIVDDYGAVPPCKVAIDEFRARRAIQDPMKPIDSVATFWRKA